MTMIETLPIFQPREHYKPFDYEWAFDMFRAQNQVHWLPVEVPLSKDVRDWHQKLNDTERNLLTQIFRFFTQGDVDVAQAYHEKYIPMFPKPELRMMMASFAAMEGIHIEAYSLLLEEIGMPETEYQAFREIKEMADKHTFVTEGAAELVKGFSPAQKVAFDIAVFSAFTEGLHLFSSFAILMNFPRFGKMTGMGQIITWSVRDESLHIEGMIRVFNQIMTEAPELRTRTFDERLRDICRRMVNVEDAFIDRAFEMGAVEGLNPDELKQYVRHLADRRMLQLGGKPVYGVKDNPLPWMAEILNGVEHANFFETRATEYSKGAMSGSWNDVWSGPPA